MGHTVVDLDKLQEAMRSLQQARSVVDKATERLKGIPVAVHNAPVNESDLHGAHTMIDELGPTVFGIFPEGHKVAAKHAGILNSVAQGLATSAQNIDAALLATAQQVQNYTEAEAANTAGARSLLANMPVTTVGGGF